MKIKIILYAVLALCLLHACKKDLGNYDYTDSPIPTIDTSGIGGTYRMLRLANIKIDPPVKLPAGHTATYKWLLYARQTSVNVVPTTKEISTTASLDYLIAEPVGNYVLEFIVTDQQTGITSNVQFSLAVTANMEFGMMVLYQGAAGGDLDFIRTPALASEIQSVSHRKNLYSLTTGRPLDGQARFIWSARQAFSVVNWITIASSNYIGRFHGNDFTFIREQGDMFRRAGTTFNPQAYVYTSSFVQALVNNYKLSITNSSTSETDAKFSGPADGDYELAPFLSPKISSLFVAVGYDQKNGRFVRYFTANNTVGNFTAAVAGQPFDLNRIGKDMLYMTSGASDYTYAFFKDKTGNGRWLYAMNFTTFSDNGQLAMGAYDMTGLPEIESAVHYQVSGFGGYAYYSTKNTIYNYAYRSSNTARVAFRMPAGEEITCMRYYRPLPNSDVSDRVERVLYVATWNGSKGKVYELSINETSGEINGAPLNVFEIDGKVADMSARARGLG